MATLYKPMILWDNVAERIGLTANDAGQTGHGVSNLIDNKHWTYFAPEAEPLDVVFTMTGDAYVDTVIVQAKKAEPTSDITVTYNDGTAWDSITGMTMFNIIKLETPIYVESVEIEITQPNNSYVRITHIWIGLSQRINNPTYEFDHQAMVIDVMKDKQNNIYILNDVIGQKRTLSANFQNVATEMDNLFDYCYRYGKPFIFAWRPDDCIYDGGLYHFLDNGRNNPYIKADRRNVSIEAETPWIPTLNTRVVTLTIETFDYALPTSYLVDEFATVGTSWLIEAFTSIPTTDLIDSFASIVT